MRTARSLEAEWRQVLLVSVNKAERKMGQLLGGFGLLDFAILKLLSPCVHFETYEPFICLIFKFIFSGRGKPQETATVDNESANTRYTCINTGYAIFTS
jgi:hypothetical protein